MLTTAIPASFVMEAKLLATVDMKFLKNLQQRTSNAMDVMEKTINIATATGRVPADIQQYRIDICDSCDHLTPHLRRCNLCKCFMDAKTWIPDVECPDKKWGMNIIQTDRLSEEPTDS